MVQKKRLRTPVLKALSVGIKEVKNHCIKGSLHFIFLCFEFSFKKEEKMLRWKFEEHG